MRCDGPDVARACAPDSTPMNLATDEFDADHDRRAAIEPLDVVR